MSCSGALGRNAKLYVKSGATDTSDATVADGAAVNVILNDATWKLVCVVDASFNAQKDKIDTSDRCSGDYKAYVPGQQEGTITFKAYKRKPIVAGDWLDVLRNAFRNNETITALMVDEDKVNLGADGTVANVNVYNMSENQPKDGPIEIDFELAVTGCTNYVPPARPITRTVANP